MRAGQLRAQVLLICGVRLDGADSPRFYANSMTTPGSFPLLTSPMRFGIFRSAWHLKPQEGNSPRVFDSGNLQTALKPALGGGRAMPELNGPFVPSYPSIE